MPIFMLLLLALVLVSPPAVSAGPPTDQLREGIERIFKILGDPELSGEARAAERRAAVSRNASELFDFAEMSKRTLGAYWDERTPAERQDFVRLFTGVIQRAYFSKIDEHGSEKTIFTGETMDGDLAIVRTKLLLARGTQMPLDYSMHSTGGRWRVYDLSIDGISLVANYRSQFNKIIRTSSYEGLVARFKSNQAEFAGPAPARAGKTIQ